MAEKGFTVNIGDLAEDEAQRIVEGAFSPFFVFRAPRKDKDNKEVTDVLVPWDDIALVIQVKAESLRPGRRVPTDPLKWVRKNLAKAGRQVAGAVRAIREGHMTFMENPLRGRVPFPRDEIRWQYGIIVVHHLSPPYDPLALVPDLQETTYPLHVLSLRDFFNLSLLLSTPADLINYLEERSQVLAPTLKPLVHEEEAVFDFWLKNLESVMAFRAQKRGESFSEEDAHPYAEDLRRLVGDELPGAVAGQIVDDMIRRVHEQDLSLGSMSYGDEVIHPDQEASVRVATELSKIPRIRRIMLGRRFLETIQRSGEVPREVWHASYSRKRSDCTLFLASPLPLHRRQERREQLFALTDLLKHHHRVEKGLEIATEAGQDAGQSYDFVFLQGSPVANDEASRLASQLFGKDRPLRATGDSTE